MIGDDPLDLGGQIAFVTGAGMTLLLCSDAASWITGQTYPVNGGYRFAL